MRILLNPRPVRQHPGNSPKLSMPYANSWPLACPASIKNIKQPTGEKK